MSVTLAFDVYGTLVDPSAMIKCLTPELSARAAAFVDTWRQMQLECIFNRGVTNAYADFSICTRDALNLTCQRFRALLSPERKCELLRLYQRLPEFDDVVQALRSLRVGFRLFAFSDAKRSEVANVLGNAKILGYFEGIVTADDIKGVKPDPSVYHYARRAAGAMGTPFWLVSSHPWDVMGARAAGLSAIWVRRSESEFYDSWGSEPNLTVASLVELSAAVSQRRIGGDNRVSV